VSVLKDLLDVDFLDGCGLRLRPATQTTKPSNLGRTTSLAC
jgi:hypothetical protein